jgi:SAM-dependent methyltransferase
VASFDPAAVRRVYNSVARPYAAKFGSEQHDLDECELSRLADTSAKGPVLDLGCGPGQSSRFLTARGTAVVAVDLSEAMLTLARERVPGLVVVTADMRTLPFAAGSLAGAVALYVLHHLPRGDLLLALLELRRTLVSNAPLLIATHMGMGEVASGDTWLGHDVEPLAGTLFQPEEMESALREASFATDAVMTRNPLPHEYQGLRIYVRARAVERPKPASAHR